jgi:hypothetical protein
VARELISIARLEADVTNQGRVMLSALAGAAVGAIVGWFYLTDAGRRLRGQLEPRLDDAMREIGRLRQTIGKAQAVASEGWRSLNQVAGGSSQQGGDWGGSRQTSPY